MITAIIVSGNLSSLFSSSKIFSVEKLNLAGIKVCPDYIPPEASSKRRANKKKAEVN